MKIVFMGTPDFSVLPLRALIDAGHEVALVLTRPDKKRGRGNEMQPTPVKEVALEVGIPVLTPVKMKDEVLLDTLKAVDADVFVVVAYGKILPKEILEMPRYGCINIHASLLPAYRGAAPIQWAIIDGQKKTGITTMKMDAGLDTGDILRQYEIDILPDETGESLFKKLAPLGAEAILDTLKDIETIVPIKQAETKTAYAKMLTKEMGEISFHQTAIEVERWIRGLSTWPSAYTYINGKMLKIWKSKAISSEESIQLYVGLANPTNIGKFFIYQNHLYKVCKDSLLELLVVQLEGKKKMSIEEFLRGYKGSLE